MEWGTVSMASMAGMAFSLIVSVGLPVVLAIWVCRKLKAQPQPLLVGACTFVIFAMILEQILHAVVLAAAGTVMSSNIFLYALYGGLAAALFEETGRFLAMRYLTRKRLNRADAVAYGVGHGGIEAVMIVGMTCVNNLVTAVMINNGSITEAMSQLDSAVAEQTYQQLSVMWQSPAYLFYMAGMERISAVILQIGLSMIMYLAVKEGRRNCLILAFAIHFAVDFLTVLGSGFLPTLALELAILAVSAAVLCYAYRLNGGGKTE